ncbi:MAG: hypothetical protein WCA16_04575 [Candidatus Sulfotelmatobacter sp.]
MKRTGLTTRHWLATLALSISIWAAPGRAQSQGTPPQSPMQEQAQDSQAQHNNDITRREVAIMDEFLDKHPEIAEQLQKDPKLIDDQKWVANHPALQEFMADHTEVRQQFDEHPYSFMRDENRDDAHDRPDITRREVATMDEFLDKHPEIAEQLQKNPKLIDDQKWIANHPALQDFMADHPEVRQQFDEHPYAFMRDENRDERWEDRHGDVPRAEVSSFHDFLRGHDTIAADLSKNPGLATNDEYLQNHTELQAYLQANPQVHEQLNSNPHSFLKSAQGTDMTAPGTTPKTMPKPPGSK